MTTDFGGKDDAGLALARQPDGKLVAVGGNLGDQGRFAVARYHPNGELDRTFAGNGKQLVNVSPWYADYAHAVVIDAQGRIVVAGASEGFVAVVARLRPDGNLDDTFSGDGKATIEFDRHAWAAGVAVAPSGEVSVVGTTIDAMVAARLRADGELDTSFSDDGRVAIDLPGSEEDEGRDVALGPNGEMTIVGGDYDDFHLVRLRPDGALDTTFSGDGRQTTNLGGAERAKAVAAMPDGRLVVAGESRSGDNDFAIARYRPDGSLDRSFSGDGKLVAELFGPGEEEAADDVAVQPNGKVVAVGTGLLEGTPPPDGVSTHAGSYAAVARFNADGTPDRLRFSPSGATRVFFPDEASFDAANGVALEPDGNIVIAGYSRMTHYHHYGEGVFALARLLGRGLVQSR